MALSPEDKSVLARAVIEEQMRQLMRDTASRRARGQQLEERLADAALSPEQRHTIQQEHRSEESRRLRARRVTLSESDFSTISVLGRGAFGEVRLVRYNRNGKVYALKVISKHRMIKKGHTVHLRAERELMAASECPWVVQLLAAFDNEDELFFIMEYVPGGDLMSLLIREETFPEHLIKFWAAEMVLAIDEVHKMNFIHRDLKPDNILIDQEGHLKLADFGLSTAGHGHRPVDYFARLCERMGVTETMEGSSSSSSVSAPQGLQPPSDEERRRLRRSARIRARSAVGTPDFAPPEVLLRREYDQTVDWWSMGIIIFEMAFGYAPFYADTAVETCRKIVNYKRTLKIPRTPPVSAALRDLIKNLLRGPKNRLGRHGIRDFVQHPFFHGIDWEGLRQSPSCWKPDLQDELDTSNFDEPPDFPHSDDEEDDGAWRQDADSIFKGFGFCRAELL